MDYRKVEPPHIERFLRYMVELNISVPMQYHHRSNVSAMFRRAFAGKKGAHNPCTGVTIDVDYVGEPRHPYTGKEVRSILETAKRLKVGKSYKGGDASRECLWLLRLEAFHGCRVQEPSQLQRGDLELIDVRDVDLRDIGLEPDDVRTLDGFIPTLWFRKECAATGKPHPEKSIKTGEDRHIALHPALWCPTHPDYMGELFVDCVGLTEDNKGEFVFGIFKWTGPARGRADYLIQKMGGSVGFLRKDCGITRPNLSPTTRSATA